MLTASSEAFAEVANISGISRQQQRSPYGPKKSSDRRPGRCRSGLDVEFAVQAFAVER